MRRATPLLVCLALFSIQPARTHGDEKSENAKIPFAKEIAPLFQKYCIKCHGGERPRASFALDKIRTDEQASQARAQWSKVARMIQSREMPPQEKPQLTSEERVHLLQFLGQQLAAVDCNKVKDPGRVTIRRLNRAEYNNTIRDLVGIRFDPADDFPSDDVGYGFDNIGDVLSMPPILMEKYLSASERIVSLALHTKKNRRGDRVPSVPKAYERIMIARPEGDLSKDECARKILSSFMRKAFRRPLTDGEVDRYLKLVKLAESQGDAFEDGIALAVRAILVSPHFLFRIEQDPTDKDPDGVRTIDEHELAARLSYFLWSSLPDDELSQLADEKSLRKNLPAQVKRMLKDEKSRAIVENFGGQWLQTRNLLDLKPDPDTFPRFDNVVREDMIRETEMFFDAIIKEDRSVLEFVDADYTFLNRRLASYYGLDRLVGRRDRGFKRVTLPQDSPRGGVLTMASVLTVTSNPTRTSPVKRGKWILENLLNDPPPAPPPEAGELKEDPKLIENVSLRERLVMHRRNPSCAVCHKRMDPLGFALENFDGVGGWRDRDGKHAVDAKATLPTGEKFDGAKELKKVLLKRKDQFARCLAEKLLTYAMGRGLEYYDRCAVDKIVERLSKNDYKFSELVLGIVESDPFQKRSRKKR